MAIKRTEARLKAEHRIRITLTHTRGFLSSILAAIAAVRRAMRSKGIEPLTQLYPREQGLYSICLPASMVA